MGCANRVAANTFTYFDATLLTDDFRLVEPGLSHAVFRLTIKNTSDVNVLISYDGLYANDVVLAYDELELNFQTNNQPRSHISLMGKGNKVFVKREVNPGKSGDIYIISYYQPIL